MCARVFVIAGGGGQSRNVLDALLVAGREVGGVFDDGGVPLAEGVPLLGGVDEWRTSVGPDAEFIPAVADPAERTNVAAAVLAAGGKLATVIHPAAVVSPRASVGTGVFVAAGCVVAPDAKIGDLSFLNANCAVDHDCELGVAVQLGPGVTLPGRVVAGDTAFVGTGAVVLPGKRIGVGAVVGAGSVVTRDVPDGVTVAGNPARPFGTAGTDRTPRVLRP